MLCPKVKYFVMIYLRDQTLWTKDTCSKLVIQRQWQVQNWCETSSLISRSWEDFGYSFKKLLAIFKGHKLFWQHPWTDHFWMSYLPILLYFSASLLKQICASSKIIHSFSLIKLFHWTQENLQKPQNKQSSVEVMLIKRHKSQDIETEGVMLLSSSSSSLNFIITCVYCFFFPFYSVPTLSY